jgi:crotonobetainyl-CoA:carnitine CoA-transferase CaiB-like acyl-CoA transferase
MSPVPGPLSGLLVLELGQIYNGPYAGLLMALGGADVIKVEPPEGDLLRRRGERVRGALYPFCALNTNKRGMTINLKNDTGRELLLELVARADVLIENFRPGVTERLGIGSKKLLALNPRLIYASGSGFGLSGPYRDYPAMDVTVQAMSGVMSITGWPDQPPVKAGPAVADFFGGIHLYAAIVAALLRRERSGEGGVVEVAMLDAVFPSLMSSLGLLFGTDGAVPLRTGNRHNGLAEAPYNAYETKDGYLALICVSDSHWQALVAAMEREDLADDPRFSDMAARVSNVDEIDRIISEFAGSWTTEALFEHLRRSGVPCAPVRNLDEVVADRHLHERGFLQELQHPEMGEITVFSSPMRGSDETSAELAPSPRLGQDNHAVVREVLGGSEERFDELVSSGALG